MRRKFLLWAVAIPTFFLFFSFSYLVYGSNRAICNVPTSYATLQVAIDDTNCDTINVDAGTYTEYVTIDRDVVIAGAGAGSTIFDGDDLGRPFAILNTTANVTLRDFSIQSGAAISGGAILNHSLLTLDTIHFTANDATQDGGAIYSTNDLSIDNSFFQFNAATEDGGAIYLYGSPADPKMLDITSTFFFFNSAGVSGGGLHIFQAHTNLIDSNFDNNSAISGGGIADFCGDLTMIGGSASNNNATGLGGFLYSGCSFEDDVTSIWNVSLSDNESGADGGAVHRLGNLAIHNSSFTSNIAASKGGAIYAQEGEIYDSGLFYNYGDYGAAVYIEPGTGEVIIDNSRLSYNTVTTNGTAYKDFGTIYAGNSVSMTVRHREVNNNEGPGLYNGGTLSVSDTQIVENTRGINNATTDFSTLILRSTIADNILELPTAAHSGAGIRNLGPLTIRHSTINNNRALEDGGGISSTGPLTLTNVTFSGNIADDDGGGLWHNNANPGIFNNITMIDNIAGSDVANDGNGGGLFIYDDVFAQDVVIKNSIIAENQDDDFSDGRHDDCSGPIDTLTYSLVGSDEGCTVPGGAGNIVGVLGSPETADLKELADNGGTTFTREPKNSSQALNAGFCTNIVRDQRGVERVVGVAGCDIGAFEDGTCPAPVMPDVDISLIYGNAELEWTRDPNTQRVFKVNYSNAPYLDPIPDLIKLTTGTRYSYSGVTNSVAVNHYFSVRAGNACGDYSSRAAVGVFNFAIEAGS